VRERRGSSSSHVNRYFACLIQNKGFVESYLKSIILSQLLHAWKISTACEVQRHISGFSDRIFPLNGKPCFESPTSKL
jgi:hypothetical protein